MILQNILYQPIQETGINKTRGKAYGKAVLRKDAPARLLKADSITSQYDQFQWTSKQLMQFGKLAELVVDPEFGNRKPVVVYRENIIRDIEFTTEELKEIAVRREAEKEAKMQLLAEQAALKLEKQKQNQVFAKEYERLEKLASPYFHLIPCTNAVSGDIRMSVCKTKDEKFISSVAESILVPRAKKGKYQYQLKSLEALELVLEEFHFVIASYQQEAA